MRELTEAAPDKLYRYLPLGEDKHLERFRCLISSYSLRASTPKDFNDPFDCLLPALDTNNVDHYFLKQRFEVRAEYGGECSTEAEQQICDGNVTYENITHLKNSIQERIHRARIICFSERNDNILLWSHYANSHRGVCLEFDIGTWKARNSMLPLFPVIYKPNNERPEVKLTMKSFQTTAFAENAIFSKGLCWAYEQEWRLVVDPWGRRDSIDFLPSYLTGVFFGVNASTKDKMKILDIVKTSKSRPLFFDGSVHNSQYRVKFTRTPDPAEESSSLS
ncbi:MAG: DUF2971 domain-containing protein [Acidithiobacillus sp.]